MTDTNELLELAAAVRALWCLEYRRWKSARDDLPCTYGDAPMPRWDGGTDRHGRRYAESVWPKIARHCLESGLDPRHLVRAEFARFDARDPARTPPGMTPRPDALLRAGADELYRKVAASTDGRLAAALQSQRADWRAASGILTRLRGLTATVAAEQALADPLRPYSALFRHCAAVSIDSPLAAVYEDAALWTYLSDPTAYDRTWGDFVPAALRERAAPVARVLSRFDEIDRGRTPKRRPD